MDEGTKADATSAAPPAGATETTIYSVPGYGMPIVQGPPNMSFPMVMNLPAAIAAQQQAVAAAAAAAATAAISHGPYKPRKQKGAEGAAVRFKKAPDAPKRFKSAFIIFSAEKHKEIKAVLAKDGRTEKTTDIAKKVSQAWRELKPDERKVWEDLAAKDKARFDVEKQMYAGPWKIAANKRTPKDPSAPKRPSSAFLSFSNKRRAELKKNNPNATNADLSKMLSKTWKTCDDDTRREYTESEAQLRAKYKVEIAEWRRKQAETKLAERKEREALAMQQVELKGVLGEKADNATVLPPAMFQYMMQGAAAGEGFNPTAMLQFGGAQFPVPPAMLSQLLANSQQQAQGALGLYGQGLPEGRAQGEQQSAQLAGFGSTTDGQAGGAGSNPPSLDQQMKGFQDPAMAAAMMAGPPAQQSQEFEQSEQV